MALPGVSARRPLAVTTGDPAGIGPDLVLTYPQSQPGAPLVVLADPDVLSQRARQLGLQVRLREWQPGQRAEGDGLWVLPCPAGVPVRAGEPDPRTATATLAMLDTAIDGCLDHTFSALVTAPLAKSVICEGADPGFTGHTEYLAARSGTERVVMMLANPSMRVALVTTHLPLRAVPDAITEPAVEGTLRILHRSLRDHFATPTPRILVLGLNPHAGEGGHLGHEETTVIEPVLARLRAEGMHLTGPLPADTAFTEKHLRGQDAVLAMYHDQGLPVLKYSGFSQAINITLGLPFIRTSVDHGTAFDLAGTGQANNRSLLAATRWAMTLAGQ